MLIGFLTPLEAEYKTFGRHKGNLRTGDEYTVQKCGVGEEAKYAAENLIKEGADLLVGWGVGGSMTRQLKTGDLLISSSFKDQRGGFFEFHTDFAELLNATLSKLQPKRVAILTVERMVLNQREKAKLIEKDGKIIHFKKFCNFISCFTYFYWACIDVFSQKGL